LENPAIYGTFQCDLRGATAMVAVRYDEIGYWSELKLEIVRKYAAAYSTILHNQKVIKRHVYVDAFAPALARTTD
jgi:hypothetical protein